MRFVNFAPTLANQDIKEDGHNLGSCHHLNNKNNKRIKNKGESKKKTLEQRKTSLLVEFGNVGSELLWHFYGLPKPKKGEALKVFEKSGLIALPPTPPDLTYQSHSINGTYLYLLNG
jgi:hypothetical protein